MNRECFVQSAEEARKEERKLRLDQLLIVLKGRSIKISVAKSSHFHLIRKHNLNLGSLHPVACVRSM
jgi:hypothetical protein